MADVRGASGIPTSTAFALLNTPTPSTPLYIDSDTGDMYALISNAVKRVAASGIGDGLTAAGTNQATAYSMTASVNVFSTVAAGTGAVLTMGPVQTVFNGGANELRVYPPSSAKINNLATNAAMLLAVNTACSFFYSSATQWVGVLSA